jgi:hypothetical protein
MTATIADHVRGGQERGGGFISPERALRRTGALAGFSVFREGLTPPRLPYFRCAFFSRGVELRITWEFGAQEVIVADLLVSNDGCDAV